MDGLARALVVGAIAGGGVGGTLFGKRHFRNIRHWWDLTVRVGRKGDAG